MEGTICENAHNPTQQESLQQSQKRIEREDDEDAGVLEEPVKKKTTASKRSKGKMLKAEDEDEEDRGATQESVQQSQKRIEREDDEDVRVLKYPVKKKTASRRAKGKMLKTEDEDEEDRGQRWKDEEIELLIALRGEMDDDFRRSGKKQGVDMWRKLHARLLPQIPTLKKSPVAVKKKFNSLFKAYKEAKLASNVSGESHHECKYYDQFESWFFQSRSVQKHVSASANNLEKHVSASANNLEKHVSASANNLDLPVEDLVDEMDLDDSLDNTKKKTSTTRASRKTKFHDEVLVLFRKMVETNEGMLKSFNRTTDILNKQMDRLIDKL